MFCTHCGASIEAQHQFCAACGQAVRPTQVIPVARASAGASSNLEKHVPILGVLWILRGGLRLLAAAWVYFIGSAIFPWMAGFGRWHFDEFLGGFIPGVLKFSAFTLAAIGFGSVAAGFGLLQREEWARPLALVMAFLALLSIPFGTALGIYTLWVLLPAASGAEYRRLAGAS